MYMNPARANPDWYDVHNKRITTIDHDGLGSTSYPIGILFGTSIRSNITKPIVVNSNTGDTQFVKELSILPVSQEFERALAFYGELLGSPIFVNSFNKAISFSTRRASSSSAPASSSYSGGSCTCLFYSWSNVVKVSSADSPMARRIREMATSSTVTVTSDKTGKWLLGPGAVPDSIQPWDTGEWACSFYVPCLH